MRKQEKSLKDSQPDDQRHIDTLVAGPLHHFRDWPTGNVPRTGAIVYTVWNQDGELVYVGMSGRGFADGSIQRKGPWGRLESHASGKRSGDQFCIYVYDYLVLQSLHNRLQDLQSRTINLDEETKTYIRQNLSFRWISVPTGADADRVERILKRGMSSVGKPLLNPMKG